MSRTRTGSQTDTKLLSKATLLLLILASASCSNQMSGHGTAPYQATLRITAADLPHGGFRDDGGASRQLQVAWCKRATVTVVGPGIQLPVSTEINLAAGSGTASIPGLPIGPNRIVAVQALDDAGNAVPGASVAATTDLFVGPNSVHVDWMSTPRGRVYEHLLAHDATDGTSYASSVSAAEVQTLVLRTMSDLSVSHPSLISAGAIADRIIAQEGAVPPNPLPGYVVTPAAATFTIRESAGYDLEVAITDPASAARVHLGDGDHTVGAVTPGTWSAVVRRDGVPRTTVQLPEAVQGVELDVGPLFPFARHLIAHSLGGGAAVSAADMDDDGDTDIVMGAGDAGEVLWLENRQGDGFAVHVVDGSFPSVPEILTVDVDGDGDMDLAGVSPAADEIVWWENAEHVGFLRHIVEGNADQPLTLDAGDIDGDGDVDLVAGDKSGLDWWENDGTEAFMHHVIHSSSWIPEGICLSDLDGDGDIDMVTADSTSGFAWWENDGSEVFTRQGVDFVAGSSPWAVDVGDLDGDGDSDIIGADLATDEVIVFENTGGQVFSKRVVASGFSGAWSVDVADLDTDGDLDILAVAYGLGELSWWENAGALSFTKHVIDDSFVHVRRAHFADVDGDGNLDVVGVADQPSKPVAWWENVPPETASPAIAVSSTSLSFAADVGESQIAPQTLAIHNSGTGVASWAAGTDADWLAVAPADGRCATDPTDVSVYVDATGLAVGVYHGTITVRNTAAGGDAVTVDVTLDVSEGWEVVFEDDFESTLVFPLPQHWGTTDFTGNGGWGLTNDVSNGGDFCAWSAAVSGTGDVNSTGSSYYNMETLLRKEIDLTASSDAELQFDCWVQTGNDAGNGFWVEISDNNSDWTELWSMNSAPSWQTKVFDISSYCGDSSVFVRFRYTTGSSWVYEGVYLDNVVVTKR